MSTRPYEIFPLGDQAATLSFGNGIDPSTHGKILSISRWLNANPFPGLKDIVLAYSSLTVIYDAISVVSDPGQSPFNFVSVRLQQAFEGSSETSNDRTVIEIPVCYEGSCAPDMEAVCSLTGLPVEEVINVHTAETYRVYMIGFLPGFPYLASVDARLRVPRKQTPARNVVAGSVGLAGEQTGIYPLDSPGGWQIIGRTRVQLFLKDRQPPCLMEPGDEVRFYRVSLSEFEMLTNRVS